MSAMASQTTTGLCEWNSLGTGEFPAKKASNAEHISISWSHHENTLEGWISRAVNNNHVHLRFKSVERDIFSMIAAN